MNKYNNIILLNELLKCIYYIFMIKRKLIFFLYLKINY